jgi:predicted anti-sigma-YlaC factor YlaD
VKACAEYHLGLSLHAAGALEPAEAAEVEAHLAACPACRAEAEADAGVLAAVRLPPVSEAERAAMRDVAALTVGEYRAAERERARARVRTRRAVIGGLAVAAAGLVAIAVPGLLKGASPTSTSTPTATATPTPTSTSTPTATATATAKPAPRLWRTPDLDTLWDDTTVVALESSAARTTYAADGYAADGADDLVATDVVLAAWDDAGL